MRILARFAALMAMSFLGGAAAVAFFQHSPAAFAGAPQAAQDAKTVKASRFELVDKDGKARGVWVLNEDNSPVFVMNDKAGKARVILACVDTECGVVVTDKKGTPALAFAFAEQSEARVIALKDGEGSARCVLAYTAEESGLLINDAKDQSGISLSLEKAGARSVSLTDKAGKVRSKLLLSEAGDPDLQLFDKTGKKVEKK